MSGETDAATSPTSAADPAEPEAGATDERASVTGTTPAPSLRGPDPSLPAEPAGPTEPAEPAEPAEKAASPSIAPAEPTTAVATVPDPEATSNELGTSTIADDAHSPDEQAPVTRLRGYNSRERYRLSGAASIYGPSQGAAVVVDYRPHWIASLGVGVGGTVRKIGDGVPISAGTVLVEATLLPVPFVVTPIIGAGFALTFGPLAEHLPGLPGRPPSRDQFLKLVPYGRFGIRVDPTSRLFMVGEILLVPDNRFDQGRDIHPVPGFRMGINIL